MGRSKFPGKPSKHCHRKRVNVLPPTGELTHGSDSSSVTVIGSSNENKQDEDLSENEGESTAQTEKSKPLREQITRKLSTSLRKNGRQRNFISKIRNKTPLKSNRPTRNNLTKNLIRKDTPNFAGKFILPSRSVHSSRVIKPNKRFIDLNESINVKKKVLSKRSLKQCEEKDEPTNETKDIMAFSNGHRVILRQARLKLPNQVGTQIPFSTKLHNGPGTIICGVCGAVRYYRFVKQARKFNIYSCESCRKFISKQIKRQNVGSRSSNILPCQMGQGTCYVPPVVRSQHWKIAKCAFRSRCPACWLKMCIKSYHLPLTLKQNLTQLLPKNMRGFDFSFNNSLPPILWQKNVESPIKSPEVIVKQRPIRFKPPQKPPVSIPLVASDVKRQKIDLKGPRVKHVCRSASIVLGQPLATFINDSNEKKITSDLQESISEKCIVSDIVKISDPFKIDSPSGTDEELISNSSNSCKSFSEKNILPKKERSKCSPIMITKEVSITPTIEEPQIATGILLDYSQELNFENRYKYGFSVVTSQKTSAGAICFLCGSAGLQHMLICSVCCEPYHSFCIESFGIRISSNENWMCIRCIPCQQCKGFDRSKVSCPKCLKIYHNDCFSSKEDSSYSKMVCNECRKCQDCGTATAYNMSSFPANMPLCLNCINKRKVGMYCPICQHSFEESMTSKMLECSKCKQWVHSECEKLTSEQYDILKLLPVSTNFTCSQCLNGSPPTWYGSVQNELYHNFNQILRLLIKNKSARSMLKRAGLRGSQFRRHLLTNVLDIDNNNCNKDIDKIYSFEESEKIQKETNSTINTLIDIKNRLCEYNSVKKFNNDMKVALKTFHSEQILVIYKNIFQNVFPWFSQVHEAAEDIAQVPYCHIRLKHRSNLIKYPALPNKDTDNRTCALCQNIGDQLDYNESRLLYCGSNVWIHGNCAYWSINVYEELDNHLQNVTDTIAKGKSEKCSLCDKMGASLQCYTCRNESYHFMCARKANFTFQAVNKSCYCPKHSPEDSHYVLKSDEDFELNKCLFVEQYPKENIRSEPEDVNCAVGSLSITNLGKIEPFISDTTDAIIPTGFICYRVFWSTIEPWGLITYSIKTSVLNPNCTTLTVDKNFTVDHTLEKNLVDKALRDISDWQRVYEKRSDEIDSEDEEEKNGAELLSPELTDTILEDLPHDILDGISVQDIFPNFSYEDMLNLDNSNTESIAESLRKPEDDDSTVETTDFKYTGRELIRTKSDPGVKPRIPPLSLTLSYKLDSALPPVTKKRKLTKESPSNMLLLQVDGTFDDSSSSECGSPVETNSINPWGISEEPVTCEKCQCTYRTQASYKRHLDTCEVLCTSESDSENIPEQEAITHMNDEIIVSNTQPIEVTVQVNEPTQPVLIQAYESYQSQMHTSVVNVMPEATQTQQPVTVQPTITIAEPQSTPTISIPVPLCVGPSITPQIVQPSIEYQQVQQVQQTQTQPMTLQQVQQVLVQRQQPARREPVVLQPIQPAPASGFVPFVDAFGQPQTNQSVQYVQIAPQVQPQTQLLQIRSDGNVIGILPSLQPTTMIVQQPQQLVLDSSGTFGWAQQPQPQIYYGFETIVQNTVMQSQQFLPTPVPGVLAANSSYSTTTQVFQTSKLEPVLDVSSNSFVLVNPSQLEIPQQYQQSQPATVVTSQTPTIIYSQPSTTQKPIAAAPQNCISLPTTPFLSDQNIPMNIVPPIPKPPTSHARPMSRVLPMPTSSIKTSKKVADVSKIFPEAEKPLQTKMEENKFIFTKDVIKVVDSPKSRNRKFEILDYKIIKSRPVSNPETKQQIFKVEEKSFKEFEPIEKIPELSRYEPLKEIEKVKIDMFEEPIKSFAMLENDKFMKFDALKNLDTLENRLKSFDTLHLQNPVKNIDPEPRPLKIKPKAVHNTVTESRLKKLEILERQFSLNTPKQLDNHFRKNCSGVTVQKHQILDRLQTNSPLTTNKEIDMSAKQETVQTKSIEVKQSQSLDMPKLEDFDKIKEGVNVKMNKTNEQTIVISEFNIRPSDNCIQPQPSNITKPPVVIAPMPKQEQHIKGEEKEKIIEKLPLEVITDPIPKPPKKESSSYGAPSILYTVENKQGFKYSSTSISDCWSKVWEAVQHARATHNMPPLPTEGKQLKSVQLIGLKSNHVKYLVEQLPGASKCMKYKTLFNFTPHPLDSLDASAHGLGAIRCQPHKQRNTEPNDMFSWLSSKHRRPSMSLDSQIVQSRRVNSFPMAMKFRNLKQTSKWSVGVYRSKIHGKGLFCLRDIESGEMVIEYAGEVIRSILTDKREKFYNSKGIGCYMFRVDDNFVVDATMKGNAARFINHSCDPNCYSKVVEILGHKHIIIFALRRILSGEELTYDYKFPFEEDKIPCTCGARRCRKFLN